MNLELHYQIIEKYETKIKKLNGIIDMKSEQVMGMNKEIQLYKNKFQEQGNKYRELKYKPIRTYFKLLFLNMKEKVRRNK